MEWLFDNWGTIMETVAQEPVENGLSILAGYIVLCVVAFTTIAPICVLAAIFRFEPRTSLLTLLIMLAIACGAITTLNVHEVLNNYQHWYYTPWGPPLDPIPPAPEEYQLPIPTPESEST